MIGCLLALVGFLLVVESKGLLIGEGIEQGLLEGFGHIAKSDPAIDLVRDPLTMHLGPEEVLLNVKVQFRAGIAAAELATAIERLKENIQKKYPQVKYICIEPGFGDA